MPSLLHILSLTSILFCIGLYGIISNRTNLLNAIIYLFIAALFLVFCVFYFLFVWCFFLTKRRHPKEPLSTWVECASFTMGLVLRGLCIHNKFKVNPDLYEDPALLRELNKTLKRLNPPWLEISTTPQYPMSSSHYDYCYIIKRLSYSKIEVRYDLILTLYKETLDAKVPTVLSTEDLKDLAKSMKGYRKNKKQKG